MANERHDSAVIEAVGAMGESWLAGMLASSLDIIADDPEGCDISEEQAHRVADMASEIRALVKELQEMGR